MVQEPSHILEAQQFDRETLEALFRESKLMKRVAKTGGDPELSKKIMICLFYEPSTRTRMSFESAMHRLSGRVIGTEAAGLFSSAAKGESLPDTVRVAMRYGDVIVLRHKTTGAAKEAAKYSKVPVINAGDGEGQHPTQALLDIYTIHQELSRIDGIEVAMVGDLRYGRTVHSLAYLLQRFDDVKLRFVSPEQTPMKPEILKWLKSKKVEFSETDKLEDVLGTADCVYMTRVQKERFKDESEYEKAKGKLVLNSDNIGMMKRGAVIMHPLPRVDEISSSVDDDPRAVYFKQAENGIYVRMALLKKVLKGWD